MAVWHESITSYYDSSLGGTTLRIQVASNDPTSPGAITIETIIGWDFYETYMGTGSWSLSNGVWRATVSTYFPTNSGWFQYLYGWVRVRVERAGTSSYERFASESESTAGPTEYWPTYYPPVTDQWVWNPTVNLWHGEAGSCVANTLASMVHVFEKKETSDTIYPSHGWIYGNRLPSDYQGEGMNIPNALDRLQHDGVPDYSRIPNNETFQGYYYYPDVRYYYDTSGIKGAKTLVEENINNTALWDEARRFKIQTWYEIPYMLSNVGNIKQAIIDRGAAMLYFRISSLFEFSGVPSSGILSSNPPSHFRDGDSSDSWHTVVILGWRIINGKTHWIIQNGWGTSWGDSGLGYMPVDFMGIDAVYVAIDAPTPPPSLPVPSSPPLLLERGSDFLRLTWGSSPGATSYNIRFVDMQDNVRSFNSSINTDVRFSNLDPGETYRVSVRAQKDGIYSDFTSENPVTTLPSTPGFTRTETTSSSVTIRTHSMVGNYTHIRTWISVKSSDQLVQEREVSGNTVVTFSNLPSGVEYRIRARSYLFVNGVWLESPSQVFLDVYVGFPRPQNFAWTTTKVSGQDFNLTWTEWNNFIARINGFREYKVLSPYQVLDWNQNNQYTGNDRFQKGQSGTIFYAYMYRQAVKAIQDMSPPTSPPSNKYAGDVIYASDLNRLVQSLNSIT